MKLRPPHVRWLATRVDKADPATAVPVKPGVWILVATHPVCGPKLDGDDHIIRGED